MFASKRGNPLSIDSFRNRVLNSILKQLGIDKKVKAMGIKRCGNYAFRHMNATAMDEISIDSRWNPSTGQYPPIFSDYYPFGGIISEADPFGGTTQLPPIEQAFTGKERDSESGNDYFGARYYASSMGRWLSPDWSGPGDPVPYANFEDPQSLNLYSYVGTILFLGLILLVTIIGGWPVS
jgi:RHS repeat-associated protein